MMHHASSFAPPGACRPLAGRRVPLLTADVGSSGSSAAGASLLPLGLVEDAEDLVLMVQKELVLALVRAEEHLLSAVLRKQDLVPDADAHRNHVARRRAACTGSDRYDLPFVLLLHRRRRQQNTAAGLQKEGSPRQRRFLPAGEAPGSSRTHRCGCHDPLDQDPVRQGEQLPC
eukprot:scaffold1474_cov256-Pinguiococcus_pyrenoidosus.AAC.13